MKVTVSLPDELFERLEDYRERCGQTRSAMFQAALERYLLRRDMEELKAEYDESYSEEMAEEDARLAAAGAAAMAQILNNDPW